MFDNERKMAVLYNGYFRDMGYNVHEEFPISGRCVDALIEIEELIITVEYKLYDKKKAYEQARDHRKSSNFSWIIMPEGTNFKDEYIEKCSKRGIGLIEFDGKTMNMVLGSKYNLLWKPVKESVLNMIDKIEGVDWKVELIVPGRPVPAQRMTQKSKWTERAQKSLNYQEKIAWAWKAKAQGKKLEGSLKLSCRFYFNDRKHGDLSNLVKAVEDGLQYGDAFDNDKQIREYGKSGIFYDNNPRVEIKIEEVE